MADRDGEPVPTAPIGPPPNHLSAREQRVYIEIVERAPGGVLTNADEHMVVIAARLEAEWRKDGVKFPTAKIPQLIKVFSQLGFSPADRSKVTTAGSKKDKGKFDDF
jgi:hypothetical protein